MNADRLRDTQKEAVFRSGYNGRDWYLSTCFRATYAGIGKRPICVRIKRIPNRPA